MAPGSKLRGGQHMQFLQGVDGSLKDWSLQKLSRLLQPKAWVGGRWVASVEV